MEYRLSHLPVCCGRGTIPFSELFSLFMFSVFLVNKINIANIIIKTYCLIAAILLDFHKIIYHITRIFWEKGRDMFRSDVPFLRIGKRVFKRIRWEEGLSILKKHLTKKYKYIYKNIYSSFHSTRDRFANYSFTVHALIMTLMTNPISRKEPMRM